LKNKINDFNVFFHVESEYEIGFSLAITVFAAEGGVIIILHPVLLSPDMDKYIVGVKTKADN
jgi:hypothetical protein